MTTETKSVRIMSERGFLHKAKSSKVSAEGFLAAHRSFLETGSLAVLTSPILTKLDSKDILPTPALEEIKNVVLTHMLAKNILAAENKINNPAVAKTNKNWTATIYDSTGSVQVHVNEKTGDEEELIKNFDHASEADDWSDRKLFDGSAGWYGVVVSNKILTKEGEALSSIILRDDAIARIMHLRSGSVCKKQTKSTSKLSWGVKAKQDHCSFSRG